MLILFLFIFQIVTLFILYKYVLVNYILQPKYNHPHIFHNQKVAMFLTALPLVLFAGNIAVSFIFTETGWLFLLVSIIMFIVTNNVSRTQVVLQKERDGGYK